MSVSDSLTEGKGSLQGFEGDEEVVNGLNVKILSETKDGRRLVKINDENSEFHGAENSVELKNIKIDEDAKPLTDEHGKKLYTLISLKTY